MAERETSDSNHNGGSFEQPDFLSYHGGEFQLKLPPDFFLPDGHDFSEDEVLVTSYDAILPSVAFSKAQFEKIFHAANNPQLSHTDEELIFARYLSNRADFTLNDETGCWELPLRAEYDKKGRARYPSVTVKQIELSNSLAHRSTLAIFRGIDIDGLAVDHLCRSHACCNPYHLEAIEGGLNTLRGALARKIEKQPTLFQREAGSVACADLIALNR